MVIMSQFSFTARLTKLAKLAVLLRVAAVLALVEYEILEFWPMYITMLALGAMPATQYKSKVFSSSGLLPVNVPDAPSTKTVVMLALVTKELSPMLLIELLKSVALQPPPRLIMPILTLAPVPAGILYADATCGGVSFPRSLMF